MTYVTSHALCAVNQELLALTVEHPSIQTKVDCFNVPKRTLQLPQSVDRYALALSASPVAMSLDEQMTLHAPAQHFQALLSAFSSAFPDFDFSTACPWNFKLVPSPEKAQASINWSFQTELPDCEGALSRLWSTLEKEISPAACSIYTYEPDRPDAFSESGVIFNMCYLFLNEKMNKIALIHLMEGGDSLNSDSDDFGLDENYGFSVF